MDDPIDEILKNYADVCMKTRDKLHLEGDVNINKLIVGTKEAKQAIKTNYRHIDDIRGAIPEKIKYVAELHGIKIAVNEAVRGAGWQLRSKEEIEAYNQAIDDITKALSIGDSNE